MADIYLELQAYKPTLKKFGYGEKDEATDSPSLKVGSEVEAEAVEKSHQILSLQLVH